MEDDGELDSLAADLFQVLNRPSVAGTVLQTALSLINSLTDGLCKYLHGATTPKRLEIVLSVLK